MESAYAHLTDSRLANLGSKLIFEAFCLFQSQFKSITRRAEKHFLNRDWHQMQADAARRLDLYRKVVDTVERDIRELLESRLREKIVWASMKAVYSGLIAQREDWELAETFFNSVTRRIFSTVGLDPQIEFVDTDFETPPTPAREPVYRTYGRAEQIEQQLQAILLDAFPIEMFKNFDRDVSLAAEEIRNKLRQEAALKVLDRIETVRSVFYRGKGAYLVGRMFSGAHVMPLVLALLHTRDGIVVDAVLMDEDEVSILFSFAHSYFHVDAQRPYDLVRFLKSILPRKRLAELYISLGYNKHGKTEFYRDLMRHLSTTDDRFEIAPGARGMVMEVFTLPGYDIVFKVIKDTFDYPKKTTRQSVMAKYHLVFKHDRAGRLVDAQEFEHLKFERDRFSEPLLAELASVAANTVEIRDDAVIIHHAYIERRLTPLNIYVNEAEPEAARAAIVDFGQAIKDLAGTNIFPGDMLLKNFGVTRHGRVVFYDYDELTLLTECHFREMPRALSFEDELSDEPLFTVGENDFFPEEIRRFLGLPPDLRQAFEAHHQDLYSVAFWRNMQERIRQGEIIHIYPYPQHKRLIRRIASQSG
ncbi:MAG: bifunctional isocitrate dehydrogenase kinase/phosphatase [Calditrichaeota bacterium]|nr:MAG: bifunctional isocitrate dehydrogenase kinase/phosphatase [Calditrichota bacterium]